MRYFKPLCILAALLPWQAPAFAHEVGHPHNHGWGAFPIVTLIAAFVCIPLVLAAWRHHKRIDD